MLIDRGYLKRIHQEVEVLPLKFEKANVTMNYFSNRISTPWNLLSNYTCSATSGNQCITKRLDNSLYSYFNFILFY